VRLLTDDDRVQLLRLASNARRFAVCRAPCDVDVTFGPEDTFLFGGPGILVSAPFRLALRPDDLELEVAARSSSARALGTVVAAAGGVAVLGGGLSLMGNAVLEGAFCDDEPRCISSYDRRKRNSGFLALGGLLTAAAGLAWIYFEGRPTTFEAR
jgi:hypothetical protein